MAPRVIVVNGGSSSGKTSIVRQVQSMLAEPWLAMSIDDFVDSLPPALQQSSDGFAVSAEGAVQVGVVFRRLEAAWMAGVAATARAGAPVIVDDVLGDRVARGATTPSPTTSARLDGQVPATSHRGSGFVTPVSTAPAT